MRRLGRRRAFGPALAAGLIVLLFFAIADSAAGHFRTSPAAPFTISLPDGAIVSGQAPPGGQVFTFGDPAGDYMKVTVGGVSNLKRREGIPSFMSSYDGAAAIGTVITISGTMQIVRPQGIVSDISMHASLAGRSWQWPATGGSERVSGRTVSQSFNLSFKVGSSKLYDTSVTGGASLSICGGVCGGFSMDFRATYTKGKPPPTTTPKPKPKPPLASDRPYIRVWPVKSPWPLEPGTMAWLPYSVNDKGGKAKVHGTLYEGGEVVLEWTSKYFLNADGSDSTWKVHLAGTRKGPLYFCMWAENPKGLKSSTPCAFLAMSVDIKRVSNGCGGEGWKTLVWVENYFGNKHTYYDPVTKRTYLVDFTDACDLHDAGYGGMTVIDKLNGKKPIDMHDWSRKKVDDKFWRDMQKLCDEQIPEEATEARAKCKGVGGQASIGSQWLYNKVRQYGDRFFDADLKKPETQRRGSRDNG